MDPNMPEVLYTSKIIQTLPLASKQSRTLNPGHKGLVTGLDEGT
jgi:hypothetical protein